MPSVRKRYGEGGTKQEEQRIGNQINLDRAE